MSGCHGDMYDVLFVMVIDYMMSGCHGDCCIMYVVMVICCMIYVCQVTGFGMSHHHIV